MVDRAFLESRLLAVLVLAVTVAPLSGCASVDGSANAPSPGYPNSSVRLIAGQNGRSNSDTHLIHMPRDAEVLAGVAMEPAMDRKLDICVHVTGEVLANAATRAQC